MKRKGTESETKAAEVTQVTAPPITESTTPAQPSTESNAVKVETVTAPPITESTTPAQPAASTNTPAETAAPPLSETTAPKSTTDLLAEAAEATHEQTATTAAPTLPPPGRGSRTFEDYLRLDWTRTNSDLATECGVSRQAIAQMRRKVEQHKANGGTVPTFADVTKAETPIAAKVIDYDAMAGMVFDMSTGILVMTFGPEWQPRPAQEPGKPGEREVVTMALSNYFKSQQVQDIPPGLLLGVVCIAYAGPRLREPNTSSKIKMAWTWLRLKISNLRKKKS